MTGSQAFLLQVAASEVRSEGLRMLAELQASFGEADQAGLSADWIDPEIKFVN